MESTATLEAPPTQDAAWRKLVAPYQHPDLALSIGQIVTSIVAYAAVWFAAWLALDVSYWLTLALSVPAAGFLVRVFIIHHDCGHGSFFRSQRVNDFFGYVTGILTYTPYHQWRYEHAMHHATSGDLDRRGLGDVTTMTVREYQAATPWRRLLYRLYRNPLILFLVGPIFHFLIIQRFPGRKMGRRERRGVHWTNLAIVGMVGGLIAAIGLKAFLLVQAPIICVAFPAGVWLFYVQHQFEDAYWVNHPDWDFTAAGMQGSTFYDLPRVLQFFSGNIGYHHIHHLASRIPNYYLERCYRENPFFHNAQRLTFWSSLKTIQHRLWDEDARRMVGFDAARE